MKLKIKIGTQNYNADLSRPIDISMPLKNKDVPKAWFAPNFKTEPVRAEGFVGSIKEGGSVNFFNIFVNPHGNGTHTECVGHISEEHESINDCLRQFHFTACLISVTPEIMEDGDRVVMPESLSPYIDQLECVDAVVMRTFPNDSSKLLKDYSGTNPPYIHFSTAEKLKALGIVHFLLDLPSLDREEDGAKFLAHKAFWGFPDKTDKSKTITELIYVDNDIKDGLYLLNIQIGSYELDASPSKPVLYTLEEE